MAAKESNRRCASAIAASCAENALLNASLFICAASLCVILKNGLSLSARNVINFSHRLICFVFCFGAECVEHLVNSTSVAKRYSKGLKKGYLWPNSFVVSILCCLFIMEMISMKCRMQAMDNGTPSAAIYH